MSTKNIIVTLIFFLVGYFSYSLLFKNNDEKLILNAISNIQQQVEFDVPLKKTEVYSRVQNIKKHIAKQITLVVEEENKTLVDINSFDDIQSGLFLGSKYLAKHQTSTKDIYVHINGDKTEATVDLVIFSNGTEQGKVNNFKETFTVELKLVKIEEKWLIKEVGATRVTN